MAEHNYVGWPSSSADTVFIASGDENTAAPSSTESTESISDAASQADSLSEDPYHELLQLVRQGAPPTVYWTCVRCEATFKSSGGLLGHHVTSCVHRNISPTAVFSTTTVVALLREVDPEHPVDGKQSWWVDTGDDGEGEGEDHSGNEEWWKGELATEEAQEEKEDEPFPRDVPAWLTCPQKGEWQTRVDRVIKMRSIIRVHWNPDGKKDLDAAMAEWNQTFGLLAGYPRYTNPRSFTSRESRDRGWLRRMSERS